MSDVRREGTREALLAGAHKLASAVGATLGPAGRNVVLPEKAHIRGAQYSDTTQPGAPILTTNDGVTVAQAIVFEDQLENMGAQLLREAALTANEKAGDGTTTAIVLSHALLEKSARAIAAGAKPTDIRRGISALGAQALELLGQRALPISSEQDIARVAAISCQDENLGELVGKALYSVGLEGVVNVDDSRRIETTLDVAEGIVFERGLLSPYLANDMTSGVAELENPYILLCDKKLSDSQDLIPALLCAAEDGRDALIVCDGIEGEALALVIENKRQGDMTVACVLGPEYGEGRRWRMDDLAVQTGGMFISEEMGISLRDVKREMLGQAAKVRVDRKRTTIMGAKGNPQMVEERISLLRHYANNTEYEFNRKRHAERLAKFVSGVATIYVGGQTDAEQRERKLRIEDAVQAGRAAFEEGLVAGGGVALFDLSRELEPTLESFSEDERWGARIALEALRSPLAQIAKNAGADPSAIVARLQEELPGTGFDAEKKAYVDMIEQRIADPVRVVRSALEAALSVASTVLLTEASVVSSKQKVNLAEAFGVGGPR